MSKLVELMQQLGADAKQAEAFEKNPDAVMKEAGLSTDEMDALKSGDIERLKKETGLENLERINSTIKAYDK